MDQANYASIKSLLESTDGIHLTAYYKNDGNLASLKNQMMSSLGFARAHLSPVMSQTEIDKFLEPFQTLLEDATLLKSVRGHIGMFRTKNSFRVLILSVDVEPICVVASTFHVKPLIRWLQLDREFLLLGIEKDMASLYQGNGTSVRLMDAVLLPAPPNSSQAPDKRAQLAAEWINECLTKYRGQAKPKLYICAEGEWLENLSKKIRYRNAVLQPLVAPFSAEQVPNICTTIRTQLRVEAESKLDKSIHEYFQAERNNLARKNIFQIARAAVQGNVRKLIVAEGVEIFGKLDRKTGGLAIHPMDLDHEDDDLLDDLAQTVLTQGGQVVVLPKEKIPYHRHVVAILNEPQTLSRPAFMGALGWSA